MSAQAIAGGVLVSLATAVLVTCSIGVAISRTVYDRIHMLGPASMLGSPLVAAAVVTREGLSPLGIKAMLVTLLLWVAGPVLAHATARAAAIRDRSDRPSRRRQAGDFR
jgi:multisubunit Na+/H+ antiporter MnhG subunit